VQSILFLYFFSSTEKSSSKRRLIHTEENFCSAQGEEEEQFIKRAYTMPPTPPSPKFVSESSKNIHFESSNNQFESSKYNNHRQFAEYDRLISNPLSQLAEISLSMAGRQQQGSAPLSFYPNLVQQAHLASLMWPSMAAAALAANYAKDLSLTPSSSPSPPMTSSPPPAHSSPVHQDLQQHLRRSSIVSSSSMMSSSSSSPPPPAHRSSWISTHARLVLEPPQIAPEDLRVIARKIDFKSEPMSARQIETTTPEVGSSEEGFSDDQLSVGEMTTSQIRQSARDDVHECVDCGKAYSTSSNLARHRQTHR